ncbi:hypothetical protein [Bacillus phage Hakuna]|uniref:Uncharacterized protein n=2 Tax=Wphvirus TaxID=1922327 RepID=A0A024B241_9CAUD|nr:hypothetical protein FP72_gp208 [Bacillus phage Hakuna]YP_009281015.1 hypothetical protein SAGEFAYGE_212 [Bacillus phage SageFayge]QDH49487.1 hypothetical protein PHIREBALL_213 [Bacillus phage Phireball]QDH50195.1 hypothetical protein ALPS_209 [Bacillus phage ALPS]AHZ10226.1 hypothetical protein [Bacillus phage Hakuna]AMW63132.1 hypothetical protein SAGEFAYGE_212 [Bacillus phage SageFayge]
MEIKETLDSLNQEIANTILKLGAKSREQAGMLSKLGDISEEIVYLSAILKQYEEDRKRYERMKRIADAERKITDLDCVMLKMGARLT